MTKRYSITVKWVRASANPENKMNNGYDIIEETRTYIVSVSDREEERSQYKSYVAKQKAIRKSEKESGFKLSTVRNIASVTEI